MSVSIWSEFARKPKRSDGITFLDKSVFKWNFEVVLWVRRVPFYVLRFLLTTWWITHKINTTLDTSITFVSCCGGYSFTRWCVLYWVLTETTTHTPHKCYSMRNGLKLLYEWIMNERAELIGERWSNRKTVWSWKWLFTVEWPSPRHCTHTQYWKWRRQHGRGDTSNRHSIGNERTPPFKSEVSEMNKENLPVSHTEAYIYSGKEKFMIKMGAR